MIGPGIATIKLNGKSNPFYRIVVPKALVDEVEAKLKKLEDRDQVRVWLEPTGIKSKPRKNAFGKYNLEVENE